MPRAAKQGQAQPSPSQVHSPLPAGPLLVDDRFPLLRRPYSRAVTMPPSTGRRPSGARKPRKPIPSHRQVNLLAPPPRSCFIPRPLRSDLVVGEQHTKRHLRRDGVLVHPAGMRNDPSLDGRDGHPGSPCQIDRWSCSVVPSAVAGYSLGPPTLPVSDTIPRRSPHASPSVQMGRETVRRRSWLGFVPPRRRRSGGFRGASGAIWQTPRCKPVDGREALTWTHADLLHRVFRKVHPRRSRDRSLDYLTLRFRYTHKGLDALSVCRTETEDEGESTGHVQ